MLQIVVIELRVVQFWFEIILVISNRNRAARSFDFEITRMISDQIALHSVQLPLFVALREPMCRRNMFGKLKKSSIVSKTVYFVAAT